MGTVGKERHSRQRELREKGQGWGLVSWLCGAWHVVGPVAPRQGARSREGEHKRQTAVYDSHRQVPFREPTARSDSLCRTTQVKVTLPPGKLPANRRL